MNTRENDRLITFAEASRMLGRSRQTIRRLVALGLMDPPKPFGRGGQRKVYRLSYIEHLMDNPPHD